MIFCLSSAISQGINEIFGCTCPCLPWLSSGLRNNHFTSTLFVGMYFLELPHARLCYCDINSSLSVSAEICKPLADVIWEIDDPLAKYIFHGFTNCQSSDSVFACWACQFQFRREMFPGQQPCLLMTT